MTSASQDDSSMQISRALMSTKCHEKEILIQQVFYQYCVGNIAKTFGQICEDLISKY
jgi:hypothetical protein